MLNAGPHCCTQYQNTWHVRCYCSIYRCRTMHVLGVCSYKITPHFLRYVYATPPKKLHSIRSPYLKSYKFSSILGFENVLQFQKWNSKSKSSLGVNAVFLFPWYIHMIGSSSTFWCACYYEQILPGPKVPLCVPGSLSFRWHGLGANEMQPADCNPAIANADVWGGRLNTLRSKCYLEFVPSKTRHAPHSPSQNLTYSCPRLYEEARRDSQHPILNLLPTFHTSDRSWSKSSRSFFAEDMEMLCLWSRSYRSHHAKHVQMCRSYRFHATNMCKSCTSYRSHLVKHV